MEEDGQPKKVRLLSALLLALKVNVECVIQTNTRIRARRDLVSLLLCSQESHTLGDTLHQSSLSLTHPSSSNNIIDK
jgi:hypothetical protein